MTADLRSPTFESRDRRNDRVFAATLLAMAAGLLLLPLALLQAPADTALRTGGRAAAPNPSATAGVTVLEPVLITGRRAARSAAATTVEPATASRI